MNRENKPRYLRLIECSLSITIDDLLSRASLITFQ